MAQPLRKIRQRIAPAVPKGGFSFTLPPLAAGAVCIVMLACIGWAFFMGYMVGHGQNPGEEMRELTGIGRPDRETLPRWTRPWPVPKTRACATNWPT